MTVSVVIASFQASSLLAEVLDRLRPQCREVNAEVIVSRASPAGASDSPPVRDGCRMIACPPGATLPEIRGAGLALATGDWIALTEDNCLARPDWLARLLAGCGSEVDVVAGVVGRATRRRMIDAGACFAEYGFYGTFRAAPQPGSAPAITCANVAYRRNVARTAAAWAAAGEWDNVIHDRLAASGARFGLIGDAIVDENLEHDLRGFARARYRHGRDYATTRCQSFSAARRVALACGTPLLPVLLGWRVWRCAGRAAAGTFMRALPFTVAFLAAWAAGEAVGYLGIGDSA